MRRGAKGLGGCGEGNVRHVLVGAGGCGQVWQVCKGWQVWGRCWHFGEGWARCYSEVLAVEKG